MFKALLADDEPMIREGLSTLIDWEACGFALAGTAVNGTDALAKHERLAPDLMVVDIRMPGMSGLELIETVKQRDPHCQFLILSGHADFDYARRAIACGVQGFILKPVDEDELMEELRRIRGVLEQQGEELRSRAAAESRRREMAIVTLLEDEGVLQPEERTALLQRHGLYWQAYQAVLVELHGAAAHGEEALASARSALSQAFEASGRGVLFPAEPYVGLLLRDVLTRGIHPLPLQEELAAALLPAGLDFTAAAGDPVTSAGELRRSCLSARERIRLRFLYERSRKVIAAETGAAGSGPAGWLAADSASMLLTEGAAPPELLDRYAGELCRALDLCSREQVQRVLSEVESELLRRRPGEAEVKAAYAHILSGALRQLGERDPQTRTVLLKFSTLVSSLYQQPDLPSLRNAVLAQLGSLMEALGRGSQETVLKQLQDFIQRHSHEAIKLETLAEEFNYNSGYLGKLFRSQTGEYFNTYLDKVRIEHAKQLLSQGMKVHEVAGQVGYASADYFQNKFKKYVGLSPSAFRAQCADLLTPQQPDRDSVSTGSCF